MIRFAAILWLTHIVSGTPDTSALTQAAPSSSLPPPNALSQEQRACSDTAAVLLARVVVLAAPVLITEDNMYLNNGELLKAFVAQFPGYFGEGSMTVRCASVAGPRLFAEGIKTYDPQAYERVMNVAPPEIADMSGEIADRINDSSTYLFELGQEVTWLGSVLPSVARGEMKPFFAAAYPIRDYKRQQIQLVWPTIQQVCSMDDCSEMLAMVLPDLKKLADDVGFGMNYSMIMLAGS